MFPSLSKSARRQRKFEKARRRARRKHLCRMETLEQRRLMVAELVNFVTTEHVDLNIQRQATEWALGARNSDGDPPIQYDNNQAVLYAGEKSIVPRPGGSDYDFIGVDSGQDFYLLPQSQNPESLYLGFASYDVQGSVDRYSPAAESKDRVTSSGRYLKATLTDVRHTNPDGSGGDGHFSMWQAGTFGGAVVMMSSYDDGVANANADGLDITDGISSDDAMWILNGGHSHFNFGFSQPGRYEVDMKLSAYFGDDGQSATPHLAGYDESDAITLYFSMSSVGQLQLDASSYAVDEDAGTASIDVVRVGGSDGRIGVNYATSNGTATAGSDYTSASGSLEFLDGETRQTITIPILDDATIEGDEAFNIVLSSPTPGNLDGYIREIEGDANGLIGAIGSTVVTIVDDDAPVNEPPTITDIFVPNIDEDGSSGAIEFSVGDDSTPLDSLQIVANSSDQLLIPDGNIVFAGSGADRTLTITPAENQFGTTTIAVTVTDQDGLRTTETFGVTVDAVNDPPTISEIVTQSTAQGTATNAIAFTVGDVESAAGYLTVSAVSSNPTLVPNGNIVIGGSGANRTVSVTPAAGLSGSATIDLTVTDEDGLATTTTFDVLVGLGVAEFESAGSLVNEQAAFRTVTVRRVGGLQGTLEVQYETVDGTATAGSEDYVASSGTLVFGPGESSKVITVQLGDNSLDDATETFQLVLSGAPGTIGTQAAHVLTINDTPAITRELESGFISTGLPSQYTTMGTPTEPLSFTVSDAETDAADLVVSAVSNNPALVPNSGIVLTGSGAERSITLSPLAGVTGTARIYVTLTDANGASITRDFAVFVGAHSEETAIAIPDSIPDVVLTADDSFTLNYTVADPTWVTTVSRSNTDLFNTPGTSSSSDLRTRPSSGGVERTLRIRPSDRSTSAGRYGTSTVTLGFSGAGAPSAQTFNVRVNPRAVTDNNLLAIPGTTSTLDVLANDVTPLDGHHFVITAVSTPENGTLEIGPDGQRLQYTPTNLAADSDQFTYTVTISSSDEFDGYSFTGTAHVKIGGYVVVDSPTSSQHVDMDFDYIDGQWIQRIRTSAYVVQAAESGNYSPTIIDSDEGVLFLDPSTKLTRPEDSLYDVLGVPAGADIWYGPSNSSGDKLFLGFATESTSGIDSYTPVGDARATGDLEWMAIQLVGFSGPGHVTAFYGGEVAFDSYDGLNAADDASSGGNVSDTYWAFANSHSHPAWFFTQAGQYELTFQTTVRVDGQFVTSPETTIHVAVDTISGEARRRENAPSPQDDTATLPAGSVDFPIDVLANDSSNPDAYESLRIAATSGATHGTVGIAADGLSLAYTPDPGFSGSDQFTYTVVDEHGGYAAATVELTVELAANTLVPFALPEHHGGAYASGTWGQTTGDFNGDGNVDLIVAGTGENALTYMQGNGDGTFQSEQLLNANSGFSSQGVVSVDYDGDGDSDVLAYEYNAATLAGDANEGTITLYRNDGDANFTREVVFEGLTQGYWIDAGDLNGDGRADVVYGANRYDFETRESIVEKAVLLQQPDGTQGEKTVLTDEYYGELVIEDVDGDGHLDVVSTGSVFDSSTFTSTSYLQIFAGNGDGTFDAPLDVDSNPSPNIHQVIDLNGDGLKDLLVYDRGADSHVGYYPQQADGSFGERVTLTPGYLYSQLNVAADINGDGLPDIVSFGYSGGYKVIWAPNLGGGVFGDPILVSSDVSNGGLHVVDVDNDSHPDIINAGSVSVTRPTPISIFINKTGENPMVLLPPAARTRIGGDPIDLQVYFGFPIDVTGTPRVALQVGDNVVYADYVSGSGTPFLDFRYTVAESDIDLDGVQLASNVVDLNGATLTDPIGGDAVLEFPDTVFDGVVVNAVGPLVSGITRLDTTPTDVASVRFEVEFSKDVLDLDAADFEVGMNAGDLAGATIDSVTGSGTTYVVTVLTGAGSGTLALSVKEDASISSNGGHPLARGYFSGEVYTLRRGVAASIEHYYTDQHADYRPVWNDGEMTLAVHGAAEVIPGGEIASNRLYTYADSNALVERSDDPAYDFVGVDGGESLYVLPSSQKAGVPYLGFTNGEVPSDLFASYVPDDPRITSSTPRPYIRYEMTDMRSSSGGEFSMWSTPSSGPRVYMTTSDGISSEDVLWSSGHLHRNLGFSKPGIYEVDVFLSGYLDVNGNGSYDEGLDPYYESGIQTMVFNVDTLGAVDDEFQVGTGTVDGDVSANDPWHSDLGDYVISLEEQPAQGTVQLQDDGTFSYEPSASFNGNDQFVYRLTNPRGGYTTATVTLSSNHSPVANDDSYTVSEDEALNVAGPGLLGNDTDADGDVLKTAVVSGPQHGLLSLNPDGSFSYVPNPDFHGTDSFTYTTTDMRYEVTPLGTLGGNSSYALDVNNLNQVSGNSSIVEGSSNPLHAFRWTDGEMADLGVVAGTGSNNFSRGYAINDSGVVVGESDNSAPKAFRWENGVIANLGTLGGTSAVASDINNAGEIVGSSSNGTATKPFVYVDGVMLELPTIAGNAASSGRAWGISPDGRFIVGVTRADDAEYLSHATLWERQADDSYAVIDMGALLDEHHYSFAHAVNDAGNAVGASVVGTVSPTSSTSLYHGIVYHDGQMLDVGTLGYLSYQHSELKDINATNQFVGYVAGFHNYPTFGGAALLGELVGEETAIIDLNELIDNEDWTLLIGEGINNGRSIVGYGKLNGSTQAYLLTPVTPDNDSSVFGNVATVTIEVTPVADDPLAVDDAFEVVVGGSVYGNVLFNDADPDGDSLTVQLDATASSGNVVLSPSGAFVYTPSAAFDGTDSFRYTVNDGTGRTATATVVINEAADTAFDIVLREGHVDIGVLYGIHDHEETEEDDHDHEHGAESPEWDLHVHDHDHDHEHGQEYHPDDVLLYVGMDALNDRPAGPDFDFIGTDAGDPVFILPTTESPDLLFLGLGTEEIADGTFLDGSLTLRLKSAAGPGHFSLWTLGPDGPNVTMATSDGITQADLMELLEGGHAHAKLGFTEMGMYQLTFQATGTLSSGEVVASEDVTYHFQLGNTVEGIQVQNGMTQRSYIRDLDVLFASDDGLDAILADPDRVQIMKYDLNGENGSLLDGSHFGLSTLGNALKFDFGPQGLGGNRNSNAGDGFYQVGIDADGDGEFETVRSFYRMLGDLNGDGQVDITDRMAVMYSLRNQNPDSDVNGDGVINSADLVLVSRANGRKLKDGLLTDDDNNS